jgi:hypothetical protein
MSKKEAKPAEKGGERKVYCDHKQAYVPLTEARAKHQEANGRGACVMCRNCQQ